MPQAVQRGSAMSLHAGFQAPTGYKPKELALSSELTLLRAESWTTERERQQGTLNNGRSLRVPTLPS